MPRQVFQLRIFLASPGDVAAERKAARRVIDNLNCIYANKGVVLQVVGWDTDAYAQLGKDAQAVVNDQIFKPAEFDLFVGIMWNRFGSPTPRAGSGTEEEFRLAAAQMKESGQPEIMFYFCNRSARLEKKDAIKQREQVIDFKDEVQAMGLPFTYSSVKNFEEMFEKHLQRWLERTMPAAKAKPKVDETHVEWLGHLTDDQRRDVVTRCLRRMQNDRNACKVMVAVDFCSFGAFGDFTTFERHASLVKGIAEQLHGKEGHIRIVVNSPAARQWQLEQYFSEAKWTAMAPKWRKDNIPKFAQHKDAAKIFDAKSLKAMRRHGDELSRVNWIRLRNVFEKYIEKDYREHDAPVILYPGIVPFHAWLCEPRKGVPYGVFALCHHQTAATAELVFSIEGKGARHLIEIVEKLVTAEEPPAQILKKVWDNVIPSDAFDSRSQS